MSSSSPDFSELKVVAFESRMSKETAHLIRRYGGTPLVAPSMREIPLGDHSAVESFAKHLLDKTLDTVVFLTGVGARLLLNSSFEFYTKERILNAIAETTIITRGPKPAAVIREFDIPIAFQVPEPNTWRELLLLLETQLTLDGCHLALQEYGIPNPNLIAGLQARGARLLRVPVYRWDFPEDTTLLHDALTQILDNHADVLLFTSRVQVDHLISFAAKHGKLQALRQALDHILVCSIGPSASEGLWYHGVSVDLVPQRPKLRSFIQEAATCSVDLLLKKRAQVIDRNRTVLHTTDLMEGSNNVLNDSRFLKACRNEQTDTTPVWIMRQAGRYLPEYRSIREKVSFMELCKNPDLAAEVTLQPVERLGVDAAIIFADILPVLEPMGVHLEYAKGEGPVIHNPIRTSSDVDRLRELESVDTLDFVYQAIQKSRDALPAHIPLLGFAGAPFTLASYAIEGGSSRHFEHTKILMYRDRGNWHALMDRLSRGLVKYLLAQIAAGVQAVQLFDSWAGCLSPNDYREYVLPYTKQVIDGINGTVPVINFATGNPSLLPLLQQSGGEVIGLDWRIDLSEARKILGPQTAVQGNLDPMVLFSEPADIRNRTKVILDQAEGRPGHIFNLGHGILPQTPVDNVIALVDYVHELSQQRSGV